MLNFYALLIILLKFYFVIVRLQLNNEIFVLFSYTNKTQTIENYYLKRPLTELL